MYTEDQNEEEIDEIINQEYKVWKYNSHYLYDSLLTMAVEWPSLTISWLPDFEIENGIATQKIIIGTHTTGTEQNYLLICKIKLPHQKEESTSSPDITNFYYSPNDIDNYKKISKKIEVEYRINHQGEVNRARPMPQKNKSNIIATKCPNGEVHIFDYLKHPQKPIDMQVKPDMRLTGHTKEGFGLNWSPLKEGYLISGSDDHRICVWDINSSEKNCLLNTYENHIGVVEDVCFNKISENVFASCGDDRKLMIWDLRQQNPVYNVEAHVQEVNTIDFNPFNEYLLITGSNDKSCALWDMRNLKKKLHNFKHHINDVISVKWNPHIMSMFASSSSDRRVDIWDLSNIGKDTNNEEDIAPSELLFTHGGHTSRVADFDWNPNQELTIASVSDDNIVQVWKLADKLYYED